MRHAIYLPPIGSFGDVHLLVQIARTAEDAGWDGFFLWDHVLYEQPVPLVDSWITLSAVATVTSRIRIGPLITPLARRRPWKVAREAVTLDHLSNGRLVLGVGLGIDYWREYSAFSEEASDDRERALRVDDGVEIIRRLWSGQPVDYEGRQHTVRDAQFLPRPVQQPGIPIWAAMLWPPAAGGPVRRAARCDGVVPFTGAAMTPEQAFDVRETVERQRGSVPFDLCLWGEASRAAEYEAAGVTWLMQSGGPEDSARDALAWIAAGPPGS